MKVLFGTESSRKVIRLLEDAGHEAVFVGGAVRDHVLGKRASDIDIATSAEPQEVLALFPLTVDVGSAHGTVIVLMDGEPIEVTTYRTEGTYTDHRRPDEVRFVKSLRDDLLRRDFTMNALAMTKEGELIDLFGGQQDLAGGLIRAVGNAAERFAEDALRMLRAIRFTAVLGFRIETETFEAIRVEAERIQHVSVERVKDEMDKLFKGPYPLKAFQSFQDSGLAAYLPLFPTDIEKLNRCVPFRSVLEGWAAFMLAGDFTPAELTRAYKLSNNEKTFLTAVHHAVAIRSTRMYSIDDYYHFNEDVLITAEKLSTIQPGVVQALSPQEIMQNKQLLPIQSAAELAVKGKDLIQWTGMKGGRWTGEWLAKIEKAVLHNWCENEPNKIKEWFSHEYKREN
ncbi:CCA tRNA nucleotidyltransferase [Sporosarcina soli]|uniref:CCA tRNA nucleotidyltransferase n=1 Tax=Sporosarcina soli TaxID=334736 RepID=A0ABW0TFR9_9BACL